MNKVLPALLGGLLIGVVLGFVLFGGNLVGPDLDPVVSAAELESGIVKSGAGLDRQPGREPRAAEFPEERAPTDAPDGTDGTDASDETDAVDRFSLPEQRKPVAAAGGGGEIGGLVRDAGGEPLSGVTVRSTLFAPRDLDRSTRGDGVPEELGLEQRVQATIDTYYQGLANRRETRTGADGRYLLSDLAKGQHSLKAWRRGYAIEPLGSGAQKVESGQTVNFRARAVLDLPLVVLLPGGGQPKRAGVSITWNRARGTSSETTLWTPTRPSLRLVPGRYEIKASLSETLAARLDLDRESVSEAQAVVIVQDSAPERITLQLKALIGIRGRLIVADDDLFENAMVRVMPMPSGRTPDLKLLKNSETSAWVHRSNPEFSFLDLAPGTYVIGVGRSWEGSIVAHQVVEVQDGIVRQDLALTAAKPEDALVVLVSDHGRQPLSGVRFTTRVKRGSSTRGSGLQGVERQPGEYWLDPSEDLESALTDQAEGGVEVSLTTQSASHGQKTISLESGRRRYSVVFDEVGTLRVTVAGFVGGGLEGRLKLQLVRSGKRASSRNWSPNSGNQLGADGRQKLGPTEVGEYELQLKLATRERYRQITIQSLSLTIGPGENFATIAVPPLYPLTVRVPGAPPGNIQLHGGKKFSSYDTLVDGSFRYDLLPAGTYTIRINAGQLRGKMTVNVPARSEVSFKPDPERERP